MYQVREPVGGGQYTFIERRRPLQAAARRSGTRHTLKLVAIGVSIFLFGVAALLSAPV